MRTLKTLTDMTDDLCRGPNGAVRLTAGRLRLPKSPVIRRETSCTSAERSRYEVRVAGVFSDIDS